MKKTSEIRALEPEVIEPKEDELEALLQTLPQEIGMNGMRHCFYKGFWCWVHTFRAVIRAEKYFSAHDTDIVLTTLPKSGTTWLKALTYSIVNRNNYSIDQSPLLTNFPHRLVPSLQFGIYFEHENPNLDNIPPPRIFETHVPYAALPDSILESKCQLIYICRNPLDHFSSFMHFLHEIKFNGIEPLPMDEAFDKFCQGISTYGPFWDHVLGYWNAHLKNPENILFLKYEDMKEDIGSHIKKIAEFIGMPFSVVEEEQGLIEKIANLCSFEHLKNLEINKTYREEYVKASSLFRKGQVGDWVNHLTPEMVSRFKNILETKLEGSGLKFNKYGVH